MLSACVCVDRLAEAAAILFAGYYRASTSIQIFVSIFLEKKILKNELIGNS